MRLRELNHVTCIIREKMEDGEYHDISVATKRQHYLDTPNNVLARKLSLAEALQGLFSKEERKVFWEEYFKTARRGTTLRSKNKKLKEKMRELQKKVDHLENILETVEEKQGTSV